MSAAVQALFSRLGYPIIPDWRLDRWDQSVHIRKLFRMLGIDCALDVGGNIGQYHEFLRLHVGYDGEMVSFEPVAELFEALKRTSAADPRWTVHQIALGEADTTAEINVYSERTLSSFLPTNVRSLRAMGYEKYLRETTLERTESVPVRRLDSILDDFVSRERRLFLKSDTQGYDMRVIRGASACLERLLGIQIELQVREVYEGATDYLEGLAELSAMGFEPTGFFPVQRDATQRVVNLDCVLIRREEAARLRARLQYPPGEHQRP